MSPKTTPLLTILLLLSVLASSGHAGRLHEIETDLRKDDRPYYIESVELTTPTIRIKIKDGGLSYTAITNWTGVFYYAPSSNSVEGMLITNTATGSDYLDFELTEAQTISNGTFWSQFMVFDGSGDPEEWNRGTLVLDNNPFATASNASWNVSNRWASLDDISALTGVEWGGDLSGTTTNPTVVGLRGTSISTNEPADGEAIVYDSGSDSYVPTAIPTDHGALTGLGDDDHPHYATDAKVDAHTNLTLSGGAHGGEADTFATVTARGGTTSEDLEMTGSLYVFGTKGTVSNSGTPNIGHISSGWNSGTRTISDKGARCSGAVTEGSQESSGHGAICDGYVSYGGQIASERGSMNYGYVANGSQTASGKGAMNFGCIEASAHNQIASGKGSVNYGAHNTNTHDYAYCFGFGVNSSETNALHARKFIGALSGDGSEATGLSAANIPYFNGVETITSAATISLAPTRTVMELTLSHAPTISADVSMLRMPHMLTIYGTNTVTMAAQFRLVGTWTQTGTNHLSIFPEGSGTNWIYGVVTE